MYRRFSGFILDFAKNPYVRPLKPETGMGVVEKD